MLVEPLSDKQLNTVYSEHPQPAGLGPRPHRQLRGALAGPDGRWSRAARRRARPLLRRDREPARRPATSCRCCAATICARTWTGSASGRSRCSTGVELDEGADAAASRRLRLRDADRARAPAQRDDAAAAADGRRLPLPRPGAAAGGRRSGWIGPRDGRDRRGPARDRGRTRRLRLRQRAPPARGRRFAGFEIDRLPVSNGALRRLRRRDGRRAADVSGSATARAAGSTPASAAAGRSIPALPVIHVSWRAGRRLRRVGRQAAADRGRVGGGRRGSGPRPGQPRRPRLRLRAGRRLRRTAPRAGAPCRCSATSGSGPRASFEAYPGFEAFPYPEYSEVFFGGDYRVLRGGGLGHAARRDQAQLPQLGPPRAPPDLRRIPLRPRPRRQPMTDPVTTSEQIQIDNRLPEARCGPGSDLARDARVGLTAEFKSLPPKYFYDELGSQLFEQITELPEYYPTRAERVDPRRAGRCDRRRRRSAVPDRARLRLGLEDPQPARRDARRRVAAHLRPGRHLRGDHAPDRRGADRGVPRPPGPRRDLRLRDRPRAAAGLGAAPDDRLPRRHDRQLRPARGGCAFLGRIASHARLRRHAAAGHRPGQGSGARSRPPTTTPPALRPASTRTCSTVLNRELDADFDLDAFEHYAFYDADEERIDIRLRSLGRPAGHRPRARHRGPVRRRRGDADRALLQVHARAASSARYAQAGLELVEFWTDPDSEFALTLARAV